MTVNVANTYTAAHPSASTEIVGSPFTVTVDSDPGKSKIKTFTTTHIAAEIYTITIQSLDANDLILDSLLDDYTV